MSARLNSCLYTGSVRHRRYQPISREFRYRLYLLYLDLSEVELVRSTGLSGWLHRLGIMRFHRSDHLGPPDQPLEESVRDLVAAELGRRPTGRIFLLTQPRHCGYLINPISLYYCLDCSGQHLDAIVAEVTSTPWNERHCYVVEAAGERPGSRLPVRSAKQMHVSPFLPMQMEYRWTVSLPARSLTVHLEDYLLPGHEEFAKNQHGGLMLDATLSLRQRPLNAAALLACLLRFPLMTVRIVVAIYLQALKLWWLGVPFHEHPHRQASQQSADSESSLSST